MLEQLVAKLQERVPGLRVIGVVEMINRSSTDIVWVGLSAPNQERWMARYHERLNALEWFFRLCVEPRLLWRRYLINNSLFALNAFLQKTDLKCWPPDEELVPHGK